eukprot:3051758-Pleurochrysis_carterae.AAC.1
MQLHRHFVVCTRVWYSYLSPALAQVLVGPHEEMFASIMTMMMWGSRSNVGGSAVGTIAALQ